MMLNVLVDYYDQLLAEHPNEIARPGWCDCRVFATLVLNKEGALVGVIPADSKQGNSMTVPAQVKRAAGISADFLCDTSSYLLGIDEKGKPDRSLRCFEASKKLLQDVLEKVCSPVANAVKNFYETWDPSYAEDNVPFSQNRDVLLSGRFLTFAVRDLNHLFYAVEDSDIKTAWEYVYNMPQDGDAVMRCLVTGKRKPIARLHPPIKGVIGSQSSGASLISFNDRSSESYGHAKEQGLNAPVSKEAAQKYGAALNYLLRSQEHHVRLGDTTIVYWSGRHDKQNSALMADVMFSGKLARLSGEAKESEQKRLDKTINSIVTGTYRNILEADFDAPFYLIGLAPNAARLSVRFFLVRNFGSFLENIAQHYRDIDIVHGLHQRNYLSPYGLLHEVENPNSKQPIYSSPLCAPLLQSILNGERYPEGFYQAAIIRIRASQTDDEKHMNKVSRGRAAIIKAYLIRNVGLSEEEITVSLNEERTDTAYNLGRTFAVVESIQKRANGSTNLAARYMDSASTTPGVVFPTLLRLANAHIEKISHESPALAIYFKRELSDLLEPSRVAMFPQRLDLPQQGNFFLGYYHQCAKAFSRNSKSKEN